MSDRLLESLQNGNQGSVEDWAGIEARVFTQASESSESCECQVHVVVIDVSSVSCFYESVEKLLEVGSKVVRSLVVLSACKRLGQMVDAVADLMRHFRSVLQSVQESIFHCEHNGNEGFSMELANLRNHPASSFAHLSVVVLE